MLTICSLEFFGVVKYWNNGISVKNVSGMTSASHLNCSVLSRLKPFIQTHNLWYYAIIF